MASSSFSSTKFDVFLSFRGAQTRDTFASHLQAAFHRQKIQTFAFDGTIGGGSNVAREIWKAIEESKVSVVIFSENFPSSIWCLHELWKILVCRKTRGNILIPVFYGVEPMDLWNRSESFADGFGVHNDRLRFQTMQKWRAAMRELTKQRWRSALKEVTSLPCWNSSITRPESLLVDCIVRDIERILNFPNIVGSELEAVLNSVPDDNSAHGSTLAALEWIFVVINLILEIPSAILDQLSSVRKPIYSLVSLVISSVSLCICIIDLVYKGRTEKVCWRWKWPVPWFYYSSPSTRRFGTFADIVGLVCAICQYIVTVVNFSFVYGGAENPIRMSIWPIMFALGLLCSKFLEKPQKEPVV